jgi:hypothetical protein
MKMRFMIIIKATDDSEAGVLPDQSLIETMTAYHEELARAGVLLDASGLQPTSKGWRVKYGGAKPTITDGPFAEAKELVAGYTLIETDSREEAIEWSRRFPSPFPGRDDSEIEVRQLYELDDLPDSEAVDRFRKLGVGTSRK